MLHPKEVLGDADRTHQGRECHPLVPENWPSATVLLHGQEDQDMGRVWPQAVFLLPAHLHGARTICQVRLAVSDCECRCGVLVCVMYVARVDRLYF